MMYVDVFMLIGLIAFFVMFRRRAVLSQRCKNRNKFWRVSNKIRVAIAFEEV